MHERRKGSIHLQVSLLLGKNVRTAVVLSHLRFRRDADMDYTNTFLHAIDNPVRVILASIYTRTRITGRNGFKGYRAICSISFQ